MFLDAAADSLVRRGFYDFFFSKALWTHVAVLIDVKWFDELFLIQSSFKQLQGPKNPTVGSDLDLRFSPKTFSSFFCIMFPYDASFMYKYL